jgi:hypothetical protein
MVVVAAALALAACASPPEADIAAPPPPASPPPPRPIAVTPTDTCGAAAVRHLIGRPRTEIPIPLNPSRQRVACTTCPVTLDYSPQRLNFFFDAETGIIKEIRCG